MTVVLVLGGARSGKSAFAERLAAAAARKSSAGTGVVYLATAQASDEEMARRILRHQAERPASWETVEEPLHVAGRLRQLADRPVILLDCLSLLINNWMMLESCDEAGWAERKAALLEALVACSGLVICVSNEVGQGIVPADELSRRYRDWLGWTHQDVAAVASSVYWVAAGIPVELKALRFEFEGIS